MPTVRRTRTIDASPEALWEVVGDPYHLPRWWPRVSRVEAVELGVGDGAGAGDVAGGAGDVVGGAGDGGRGARDGGRGALDGGRGPGDDRRGEGEPEAFTEVLMGPSGKIVRADFDVLAVEPGRRIVWSQRIEFTPFARVLRSAETEIALASERHGTQVAIELRQELQGFRGGGTLSLRMSGIARFGGPLVRRAAHTTIDEALDGLERIVAR